MVTGSDDNLLGTRPNSRQKINNLENRLMPQIDYHLMGHIILKVYIQINLEKIGSRYFRLIVYQ